MTAIFVTLDTHVQSKLLLAQMDFKKIIPVLGWLIGRITDDNSIQADMLTIPLLVLITALPFVFLNNN